jgi:hypothetical protein
VGGTGDTVIRGVLLTGRTLVAAELGVGGGVWLTVENGVKDARSPVSVPLYTQKPVAMLASLKDTITAYQSPV